MHERRERRADARAIAPLPERASRVKFEDMQRITWLNIMLEKLWPYVDRAVKTTVKEYLEPLMNEDETAMAIVMGSDGAVM